MNFVESIRYDLWGQVNRHLCSPSLTTFGSSTRGALNKLAIENAVGAALLASIEPKRALCQHLTQQKLFNGLYS